MDPSRIIETGSAVGVAVFALYLVAGRVSRSLDRAADLLAAALSKHDEKLDRLTVDVERLLDRGGRP
jgi:Zn-dependent protease with chaperone function